MPKDKKILRNVMSNSEVDCKTKKKRKRCKNIENFYWPVLS
jgi:hypothetical protein